tara:strand:+ start:546 stop:734 length:189 start_codon:yes stop_codon:yes gene_type:complete
MPKKKKTITRAQHMKNLKAASIKKKNQPTELEKYAKATANSDNMAVPTVTSTTVTEIAAKLE